MWRWKEKRRRDLTTCDYWESKKTVLDTQPQGLKCTSRIPKELESEAGKEGLPQEEEAWSIVLTTGLQIVGRGNKVRSCPKHDRFARDSNSRVTDKMCICGQVSQWILTKCWFGGGSVAKLCPTLCNPMDHSPPGPSVHEISQVRILEWVAMLFSRASSQPRDRIWVSCIAGDWGTREAQRLVYIIVIPKHRFFFPRIWGKAKANQSCPFSEDCSETEGLQ